MALGQRLPVDLIQRRIPWSRRLPPLIPIIFSVRSAEHWNHPSPCAAFARSATRDRYASSTTLKRRVERKGARGIAELPKKTTVAVGAGNRDGLAVAGGAGTNDR
jgi:hypothetical protein